MSNAIESTPIYQKTLSGGGMWSQVVGRGKTVRLTDLEGDANVGALFYNADILSERYNMPDTLKGQHTFYLTSPFCLHSDMGRLFASVTKDTCGWHDTVCGCSDAALVEEKYGEQTYQEARNDWYRNGRDCFLIELGKWGLGKRDLVPNLNFFSKVVADEGGNLTRVANHSGAGSMIELRLEMDTLIVLNTCQHPLDDSPVYSPKPVKLEVFPEGELPAPDGDDACYSFRPENGRAAINTHDYYNLRS